MQGFWTAEFGTSSGRFGGGVIVFRDDGTLVGGDSEFFYLGSYSLTNATEFHLTIEARPFITNSEGLFCTFGLAPRVELIGTLVAPDRAIAQGETDSTPAVRIGVKLTRRD